MLKVKYLILLTKLRLLLLLPLKIKFLVLVIQSRKTDDNTKINEIEKKITDHDHSNKYITTPEFNKLTSENFAARLKQANLASKSDLANFLKKIDLINY